ncbi:DUF4236 domain-containing protein [Klebsiella pneumoniae]|uniref:DUF4236 domain-containing protein n=1 Tax=Klebsiella pneumoniae TaxID=573 RepID=A0A927E377_KLEPN|nr:DUF4236 domain-containing protein [Klebsiella pneumoniae]
MDQHYPGVRVNLSNGAPSLSIGPVELRCQWERMERLPTGLPGTGLSYRTRIDRTARERVNTGASGRSRSEV